MSQELTCILCGRVIKAGYPYGRASYRKHVEACEKRTPAERAEANRQAQRREEKQ